MPKLESYGNRPLQITFKAHLKILVYFILKSISPHNIFFKYLNKMILLAMKSLPKTVLKNIKNNPLMQKPNWNLLRKHEV